MRKIILVIFLLVTSFCFSGCWGNALTKEAETALGLSLSSAEVIEEWDTHGGFHGDGTSLIVFSVEDDFEVNVKSKWQPYPLTETAYEYYYEWGGMFDTPNSEGKAIPEITNGYWYFEDTGPQNWIFSAFDENNNLLYYYTFDS